VAAITTSRRRPWTALGTFAVRPPTILPWLLLTGIAVVVLYPLSTVVVSSFRDAPPGSPATFTLGPWTQVLTSSEAFGALLTTFKIVIPKVCLAVLVAASFAWTMARTNIPFKPLIEGVLRAGLANDTPGRLDQRPARRGRAHQYRSARSQEPCPDRV